MLTIHVGDTTVYNIKNTKQKIIISDYLEFNKNWSSDRLPLTCWYIVDIMPRINALQPVDHVNCLQGQSSFSRYHPIRKAVFRSSMTPHLCHSVLSLEDITLLYNVLSTSVSTSACVHAGRCCSGCIGQAPMSYVIL